MSKEVKRYSPDTNGRMREWPDGDYATWDDYDELAAENDRLRTKNDRMARERQARQALSIQLIDEARGLRAERDRLREALEKIEAAECKSSPTATDFGISWDRGILIWTMKDIARAALQGAQP